MLFFCCRKNHKIPLEFNYLYPSKGRTVDCRIYLQAAARSISSENRKEDGVKMPDVCPVSRFSSVGTNGYMGYPSDFLRLNRNDPGIDPSPLFPHYHHSPSYHIHIRQYWSISRIFLVVVMKLAMQKNERRKISSANVRLME